MTNLTLDAGEVHPGVRHVCHPLPFAAQRAPVPAHGTVTLESVD